MGDKLFDLHIYLLIFEQLENVVFLVSCSLDEVLLLPLSSSEVRQLPLQKTLLTDILTQCQGAQPESMCLQGRKRNLALQHVV